MQLTHASSGFCYSNVDQILAILCRFVNNVAEPKLYLPQSYVSACSSTKMAQHRPEVIERQMTGKLTDEERNQNNDIRVLRIFVTWTERDLERATGRISKAKFEKLFGQNVVLEQEIY